MATEAPFLYCHEIEVVTVSTLWHYPEWLPEFMRRMDLVIHISQQHLRIIVEAINLAYAELGEADFYIVATVVRELRRFDEVGGFEGLNEVYGACEPITEYDARIYDDYLRLLQEYALQREERPPQPAWRFSGGRGTLLPNKVKRRQTDPDWIGEARVCGRSYVVKAWTALDDSFLNFRLQLS